MSLRKSTAFVLAALLILAACSSDPESGSGEGVDDDCSVACQLAVVGGDINDEASFQKVINCIMATGIEGAETEQKVGDTLVASWQQSSQQDTLLEWGQALCIG